MLVCILQHFIDERNMIFIFKSVNFYGKLSIFFFHDDVHINHMECYASEIKRCGYGVSTYWS